METKLLEKINSPKDLKSFSIKDLENLSSEIRNKILQIVSKNGGHLSSNLGVVELTVALHRVFNSPKDKFIFDTSHQTYAHKILTDRNKNFHTLRQFEGICGFSSPKESIHDPFFCGHCGAAFSQSLGLAKNRDFLKEDYHIIPIIGDGSLTCGMTLEALNNIDKKMGKFILILNDNKMAISKNVGNITNILTKLINNPTSNKIYLELQNFLSKIPKCGSFLSKKGEKFKNLIKTLTGNAIFFEQFHLSYIGPIDGHNIKKMIDTFSKLKNLKKPVLIHVITKKGKGLKAAILNPTSYHGVKPFNIETGKISLSNTKTFSQIFGDFLVELGKENKNLFAITPAMLSGSNLLKFKQNFPNRCIDVGIAESHCITFAGALGIKNIKVIASIYSTFLQRAFDNIFHDVTLQNSNIIIAIDRAGFSGKDGTTHHGIYDIAFLNALPNIIIAQPKDGNTLKSILKNAINWQKPTAIRFPNIATNESSLFEQKIAIGKGQILSSGKDLLIIPLGHMYKIAFEIKEILKTENINPTIVDPIFIKPLDTSLFTSLLFNHKFIITIEEHSLNSGFGVIFNNFLIKQNSHHKIMNFGIPDEFIEHGKNEDLLKKIGLDAKEIAKKILKKFNLKKECQPI